MSQKTQTNFLLTSVNIVALSYFLYPPPSWTLPIYLVLSQLNITDDVKKKMQMVSICSLVASFFVIPWITDLFASLALGLAMNVGCRLDTPNAAWIVNSCVGFGIILGSLTSQAMIKYQTARDMALLVCTLPNIFMAQDSTQNKNKTNPWFFNPFYDRGMTYSIGFIGGVFLPLSSINKHTRFLIISIILLMTIFIQDNKLYDQLLSLIRGLFIFDETRHKSQFYFLIGFLVIDIFAPHQKYNYLFVGYLVISVMLWHRQDYVPTHKQKRPLQQPLMIQLKPIQNQRLQIQSD